MKKQAVLLLLSCTLVCILVLSGCSSNAPTHFSIQDILSKAKTIESMKYNKITTMMNSPVNRTMTIWEKPPFMKINASMGEIYRVFIKRPDGFYIEAPDTHIFKRLNMSSFPEDSLVNQSAMLLSDITYSIFGNQTIDGVATTILQYSNTTSGGSTITKVWIWNDKGIPIQTLVTVRMGDKTFITTMVMKNFDFSDIPDSEFSVV